jgi:hypothetical protein
MSAVQTSVRETHEIGLPGQEYDCAFNDKVTKIATVDIPFGVRVTFHDEGVCSLPDSQADVDTADGGIALRDHNKPSDEGYKAGDAVTVLTRGRAWVLTEEAVAHDDAVFVRTVAAGSEQLGAFRTDADGTDAFTPSRMRWFRGAEAGTAVLEVG